MIFLGGIELVERSNFRYHFAALRGRSINIGNEFLRGFLLRRRGIEHGGAVLRAHVVSLPVQRAWVVRGKEHREEVLQAYQGRIVDYFNDLGMAGLARADSLIRRIGRRAAGISRLYGNNALEERF